jgi:hypothetical protein
MTQERRHPPVSPQPETPCRVRHNWVPIGGTLARCTTCKLFVDTGRWFASCGVIDEEAQNG